MWLAGDALTEISPDWKRKEFGVLTGRRRVFMLCWAADAWVSAAAIAHIEDMRRMLRKMAATGAGLVLRLPRCSWTRLKREGVEHADLEPHAVHTNLAGTRELARGECSKAHESGEHDA